MRMPDNSSVLHSIEGHVSTITFNRPHAANTINLDLSEQFNRAVTQATNNDDVRVIVLTGNGGFFCGGGDLTEISKAGDNADDLLLRITDNLHAGLEILTQVQQTVVAALNGSAAGAGMSLAIACDYVIASSDARMTMAYTKIGLTPDCGASWFLPRQVGVRQARKLLLQNPVLTAEQSLAMGLIDEICEPHLLQEETRNRSLAFSKRATGAVAQVNSLLACSSNNTLHQQLELESATISRRSVSEEGKEGIKAFLEKRKPRWEQP